MSGQEWQIIEAIRRLTWGWGKKSAPISLTRLQKLTGLARGRVVENLAALEARKMIVRKTGPGKTKILGIQKDYSKWVMVRKSGLSKKKVNGPGKRTVNGPGKRTTGGGPENRTLYRKKRKSLQRDDLIVHENPDMNDPEDSKSKAGREGKGLFCSGMAPEAEALEMLQSVAEPLLSRPQLESYVRSNPRLDRAVKAVGGIDRIQEAPECDKDQILEDFTAAYVGVMEA